MKNKIFTEIKQNTITINDYKVSQYLYVSNICCPCCNQFIINYKLLFLFDEIQTTWKLILLNRKVNEDIFFKLQSLITTSACRCMDHHIEIYKKKYPDKEHGAGAWKTNLTLKSTHLLNTYKKDGALDIYTQDIFNYSPELYDYLLNLCLKKFKRVGYKMYNKKLIHIDTRNGQGEW